MTTSAPTYMHIINGNPEIFRGVNFHEESMLIAKGILHDDWAPLIKKYVTLDGRPLYTDWYQDLWLRVSGCKLLVKSRRIGVTEISTLKKTLRSQFIPIEFHMVSLTQKHTREMMGRHEAYYDCLPSRIRARRIEDTKEHKKYLILGETTGGHTVSDFYGHPCSSKSVRGLGGDVDIDEFAFFPINIAQEILKAVTPLLALKYTGYDDSERSHEINIISTHFGDDTLFNQLVTGDHDFGRSAYRLYLPWTVCNRVASRIEKVAEGMTDEEFREEMCCVPLSDKGSALPNSLISPILKEMEFDQTGIVVDRDSDGRIVPFDRSAYNFVSLGCDYASFKAETTFWAWGMKGWHIEPICFYRMTPEHYGGSIDEDLIWERANLIASILLPDYFGYDATGVGAYLSRVLFDPAFGFKEDRRPRTDAYPYAEAADPVQMSNEFKSAQVTKLTLAIRQRQIIKLPLDMEMQRQYRIFKRTITPQSKVRYAAEGKAKKKTALDDIVCSQLLALAPIHIEARAVVVAPQVDLKIEEISLIDKIAGIDDILTTRSFN